MQYAMEAVGLRTAHARQAFFLPSPTQQSFALFVEQEEEALTDCPAYIFSVPGRP
jgi:hypothetical protein